MPQERIREACESGFVVDDAYPVSRGHTLVISLRHVPSFFDLKPDEMTALLALLHRAKRRLDGALNPDGYNVGVNVGQSAGQTVMHTHIHLIPRYAGDNPDPTGGVRNVIPGKGNYQL
jgi:diadenosine tetraphosphate (Ap4A) HIT family hydrolase